MWVGAGPRWETLGRRAGLALPGPVRLVPFGDFLGWDPAPDCRMLVSNSGSLPCTASVTLAKGYIRLQRYRGEPLRGDEFVISHLLAVSAAGSKKDTERGTFPSSRGCSSPLTLDDQRNGLKVLVPTPPWPTPRAQVRRRTSKEAHPSRNRLRGELLGCGQGLQARKSRHLSCRLRPPEHLPRLVEGSG